MYNRDGVCLLRGTDGVFVYEITQVENLGVPLSDAMFLRECFPNFGSVHEKIINK